MDKQGSFTKARYLKMCSMQGIEPNPKEMPIDLSDFPQIVREALDIFNRLPDRYTTTDYGPLYIGKDLATLPMFLDFAEITDKKDRKLSLDIVQHLDSKAVKRELNRVKQISSKNKAKARQGSR